MLETLVRPIKGEAHRLGGTLDGKALRAGVYFLNVNPHSSTGWRSQTDWFQKVEALPSIGPAGPGYLWCERGIRTPTP